MGVLVVAWAGVWLADLLGPVDPAPPPGIAAGNVADPCQWPTVVSFRAGDEKCTGTLVHPEIVVTAAHCMLEGTPERMRFGEEFSPAARTMDVAECWPRPEYAMAADPAEDIAACRLVAPVSDMPLTPLLGACETSEALVTGADLALVGFGIADPQGEFGTKRYAFTRVVEPPREDGTFVAGDGMVDGCDGDSGGPALVRLRDGTWHVAGVLVYGPECGQGPSRYLAPARHLPWIEDMVERDLTPCRDDEGAWDEGPQCSFAADPQAVADAWDLWCDGARAVPSGECTMPPGDPGTTGDTGDPTTGAGAETTTGSEPHGADPVSESGGCGIAREPAEVPRILLLLLVLAGARVRAETRR